VDWWIGGLDANNKTKTNPPPSSREKRLVLILRTLSSGLEIDPENELQ
jgi:hypothetical protein